MILVVLIFVLIILRIILGFSKPFFLVGSIVASLIFIILLWLLLRYLDDQGITNIATVVGCTGLTTIASAFAIGLVSVAVLLSLHLRSPLALYLSSSADFLLAVLILSIILIRRKMIVARRNKAADLVSDEELLLELELTYLGHVGGLPKRFRYEELRAVTLNFKDPIGRGGSGSVFKGFLPDGFPVAVKRIEGEFHGERAFRTELTTILSVQHVNLARILGYCLVPGGCRYLVYEFVENGSLDRWIFSGNDKDKDPFLTWKSRYQVAIDVAKALAYLHDDCRSRILHLDVKPQNILLDSNFRACVSDFGISRMMEKDVSRVVTTVRGTRGYLAPEWFAGSGISDKSDVYSYGIVLLELVGGRRSWDFVDNGDASQRSWFYLPKTASEKMREGKVMEVVDERLNREIGDEEEVRLLVYVALWCIQDKAELRPTMEMVVSMLKGHVSVSMPPETKMFLVDHFDVPEEVTGDPSRTQTERPLLSTRSFTVSTQPASDR